MPFLSGEEMSLHIMRMLPVMRARDGCVIVEFWGEDVRVMESKGGWKGRDHLSAHLPLSACPSNPVHLQRYGAGGKTRRD